MDINISLFYFINHSLENPIFNNIMPLITNIGGFVGMVIILIAIIVYAHFKKKNTLKKIATLALIACLVSDIFVVLLKNFIHEPRPFVNLDNVHLLIGESDPNSFPSGHTTTTFSIITIFVLNMKKLFKTHYKSINIALMIFALLIPFSRIYVGVHYPFDVLAGGIIGFCGAFLINKLNEVLNIKKI